MPAIRTKPIRNEVTSAVDDPDSAAPARSASAANATPRPCASCCKLLDNVLANGMSSRSTSASAMVL